MDKRTFLKVVAPVAALMLTGTAHAGWNEFWSRFKTDYHRNNAWPEPFVSADRAATREPFELQKNNGWRLQNTIGTLLFDKNTNEVNQAGEQQIRWILTQTPPNRRAVFVLRGETKEQTDQRVDSVQRCISKLCPEGELPPVLLTSQDQTGGPGEYFQRIDEAMKSSMPTPRISSGGAGGGAGGASGGGGGSGK